jgi:hypothetical protein
MKVHETITLERVQDAVLRRLGTLDNPGFCIACGGEVEGIEPDARRYPCAACQLDTVFGANELLIELGA